MTTPGEFQFAPPADGGQWFTPKDHLGHLILVKRVGAVDESHFDQLKNNGQGGLTTKVAFDYVDLDDATGVCELVEDALNTHPGIVSRIRKYSGSPQMVLGRITTVAASQPGRSPAFILEDASQDTNAKARAGAWLTAWQQRQFAAPAPAAAPPVPAPAAPPIPYDPNGQLRAQQAAQQATTMSPADQLAAYQASLAAAQQQAQPVPAPVVVPPPAAAPLPVIPGYTPEQVANLVASGVDIAGVAALANQLGAPQPQ